MIITSSLAPARSASSLAPSRSEASSRRERPQTTKLGQKAGSSRQQERRCMTSAVSSHRSASPRPSVDTKRSAKDITSFVSPRPSDMKSAKSSRAERSHSHARRNTECGSQRKGQDMPIASSPVALADLDTLGIQLDQSGERRNTTRNVSSPATTRSRSTVQTKSVKQSRTDKAARRKTLPAGQARVTDL